VFANLVSFRFVNDVCDIVVGNIACKLFAGDIKLYLCVETHGTSGDLDVSLNNMILWANRWQL